MDNGNWNKFNFEYFFGGGRQSIIERTRKIFYVCCSRTKKNLVVFFSNPSQQAIDQASEWFGKNNVIEINKAS